MDANKKKKLVKAGSIIINVLVGIILVLAIALTVYNLYSKNNNKGYTNIAGKSYVTVQTTSMASDLKDGGTYDLYDSDNDKHSVKVSVGSFDKGDMLRIKLLKGDEKKNLKVGDVVSFTFRPEGTQRVALNSHRIVDVINHYAADGTTVDWVEYVTKGDNNPRNDSETLSSNNEDTYYRIVGVVQKNVGGIGKVFMFFQSSTGFLCLVVIPSFLIVAYFAFNLIREIMRRKAVPEDVKRARMEAEIIEKLRAEGKLNDVADSAAEAQPAEPAEPTQVAESSAATTAEVVAPVEAPAEPSAEVAEPPAETAEAQPAESAEATAEAQPEQPAATKSAAKTTTAKSTAKKPAAKTSTAKSTTKKPAAKTSTAKSTAKKPAAKTSTAKTTAKKPTAKNTTEK